MAMDSRLRDRLLAEWRSTVCHLPPARRLRWLAQAAIAAGLGGRRVRDLIRGVERVIADSRHHAPSVPWMVAFEHRGEPLPPGMVLSREKTRLGEKGRACRRWTPPVAVELEDHLDAMDAMAALIYVGPASASAAAIDRLRLYGRAGLTAREARRAQEQAGEDRLSSAPMLRGDVPLDEQSDDALIATVRRGERRGALAATRAVVAADVLMRRAS